MQTLALDFCIANIEQQVHSWRACCATLCLHGLETSSASCQMGSQKLGKGHIACLGLLGMVWCAGLGQEAPGAHEGVAAAGRQLRGSAAEDEGPQDRAAAKRCAAAPLRLRRSSLRALTPLATPAPSACEPHILDPILWPSPMCRPVTSGHDSR